VSSDQENPDQAVQDQSVHRFVSNDLTVRAAAVDATKAVQEMQALSGAMPLAAIGLGRAMVGSILMASNLKEGQEVGVYLRGNGPLVSLYAEATFEGHVRGYCPNPLYQAPQLQDILNVGKALGNGTLTVARHQPFQRQPFQGMVDLVSGEVGDDIAHYLVQSQQIRSLVSLGVYLDEFGKVQSAGGVLLEVMPGVEDEIVQKIYANHEANSIPVSTLLRAGAGPEDLVAPLLKGVPFTRIPHDFPVKYHCPCNSQRVIGALSILGVAELEEMIRLQEPAEITCQICGRNYQIKVEDLQNIKDELRRNSMH
jgi:molecular chaperone Hsp33